MAFGDESFDELDKISDPTYDELYNDFKELHDDWMKIGKKNTCVKNKIVEFTNENESLSTKITCLELENKLSHDKITLSNDEPSTSYEYVESHVDDLKKKIRCLRKGILNLVMLSQIGKRCWITCFVNKNVCLTREVLTISQI